MSTQLTTVVKVYMVPSHLCRFADQMERMMATSGLANGTRVATWFGKEVDVEFHVDVERWERDL